MKGKWGGIRKNAGRKATGIQCVGISLTLKNKLQADCLKALAEKEKISISKLVIRKFNLDDEDFCIKTIKNSVND
jgi:hypothetical protein